MENKRLKLESAAKQLAADRGAINITRSEVCECAGIPDGAFTTIMGETFPELIRRLNLPPGETVERRRADPDLRRQNVLDAAITMAKFSGYSTLTREDVALRANVSPALVSHYFGTIEELRVLVLQAAVKRGISEIIAQGIVKRDPLALGASQDLKDRAISYLAGL